MNGGSGSVKVHIASAGSSGTGGGVATQPTSPNPLNNAPTAQPYQNTETRLQLSVRTKIATGLLPLVFDGNTKIYAVP